jgi:hypothetical protein
MRWTISLGEKTSPERSDGGRVIGGAAADCEIANGVYQLFARKLAVIARMSAPSSPPSSQITTPPSPRSRT